MNTMVLPKILPLFISVFFHTIGVFGQSLNINNDPNLECQIWLAPSTITGAGLGMYAGKDFVQGDELLPTGDSLVPITDYVEHTETGGKSHLKFLWDEYTWDSDGLLASGEGRFAVNVASPGFGSAANSFLPLYNVHEWYGLKDTAGLHRSRDPGIGAFSPYHDRKSTAKQNIKAGQELFVSYGSHWFITRPHLGPIPVGENFDESQQLIESYRTKILQSIDVIVASDVWDTFVKNTKFDDSRTIGAFHHSDPYEMRNLTEQNTTLHELRKQQSARSVEWLRQHGTCGDHIKVKRSTIQQAGRGAFANRNLPNGTTIAQLPMIHITDRSVLTMYNYVTLPSETGTKYVPSVSAGVHSQQLLLNYCYGHRDSTLVLCPYGPLTNFFNHNQSLVNAKLQWGREESGNHMPYLLERSIEELTKDATAKLAMEVVALRDIVEGEEIFIDYGTEWETAWNKHVEDWKPVPGATRYKPATDYNSNETKKLPTVFEQLSGKAEPFPSNIGCKCDLGFVSGWTFDTLDNFTQFHEINFHECVILSSKTLESGHHLYDVDIIEVEVVDEDEESTEESPAKHRIVRGLPQMAIRFFDKELTSDIHLPNAFRHDVRIPDPLFPDAWKNVK